ncbi:MAG: hypothetical protein LUQ40_07240, partial [Methanomicrobiales archaeon]|nr:hypothetical protein [Methanomicrobiales archaeon]
MRRLALVMVLLVVIPAAIAAAITCPFGLVNDPYPGQCSRYVDANGNGFCDLSQSIQPTPVPT